MATRIAWWLNLDAALELEQPRSYEQRADMATRVRELAPQLRTLIDPDDVLLTHSEQLADAEVALAFCPTPSARAALRRLCPTNVLPAPALEVLVEVTKRSFCAQLGQTLEGATYVRDLPALEAHVARPSFSGEWLLKRDFSFAGRERRRVRDGQLDASTRGFAKRSFERGQGLQVEPYVARAGDFAMHGFLLKSGVLQGGPLMVQRCDERGVWQASSEAEPGALSADHEAELVRRVHEAGAALHAAGYFGPFGVDAFLYHDARGELAFQPRSEVNARFSMGYPRSLLERVLPALMGE